MGSADLREKAAGCFKVMMVGCRTSIFQGSCSLRIEYAETARRVNCCLFTDSLQCQANSVQLVSRAYTGTAGDNAIADRTAFFSSTSPGDQTLFINESVDGNIA